MNIKKYIKGKIARVLFNKEYKHLLSLRADNTPLLKKQDKILFDYMIGKKSAYEDCLYIIFNW